MCALNRIPRAREEKGTLFAGERSGRKSIFNDLLKRKRAAKSRAGAASPPTRPDTNAARRQRAATELIDIQDKTFLRMAERLVIRQMEPGVFFKPFAGRTLLAAVPAAPIAKPVVKNKNASIDHKVRNKV